MKKLLLALCMATMAGHSIAQNQCGTHTDFADKMPTYKMEQNRTMDESPVCVRVFFHIVRNSAGTNGYNPANFPFLLDILSQAYNPHNILIVNAGFDFIDNDTYGLEFNDGEFNALTSTQNVSNAVNCYLLPVDPFNYAGRASAIPGNSFVVGTSSIHSSVTSHELGHCLNLFHTHHQIEIGGCGGNPGSWDNCGGCSDFVCDTPVDPGINCATEIGIFCEYTPGDGYTPDTRNIMSYACSFCHMWFSAGQGERMRAALRFDPMLSNFVTTTCVTIQGTANLCLSSTNTYFIDNPPAGATYHWTISNTNVAQIQGPDNGVSVVVARIADGSVTLRCDITLPTGVIFATRDLTVGKPYMTDANFTKNGQMIPLAIDWYQDGSGANTLCKGVESNVTSIWSTATNVTWTGPGYSHPSVWHDYGLYNHVSTMKLHIFQVPGQGFWTVTGVNGCGSTSYPITFNAQDCTGQDPCSYFKVSPNPVKDGDLIIIAKPPPVECPPIEPFINIVNIYDDMGTLVLSKQGFKTSTANLKLPRGKKGIYVVEIITGKHIEKHKIIVQ